MRCSYADIINHIELYNSNLKITTQCFYNIKKLINDFNLEVITRCLGNLH